MLWLSSIPAGISTLISVFSKIVPSPLQLLHFSFIFLPCPLQSVQTVWVLKLPKIIVLICPLPLQVLQFS